ncbi:ROK family transcriptional regulator [Pullulanibacillus sp. KACC 23026]|uniref:ROK family transcriptional regulator n=1 Tax=Pullulanibacillus sp. KACC 23026 TaxID=3028315 RepID=UPI0023B00318|nr:ROK family transcriptional regulator [Pullulanibacillus sp. KACC 23026]WEG12902.1 ROK family transcriptional regulator [Pullulanibacillus sp. KACC 23026]
MSKLVGSFQLMKSLNRSLILNTIRQRSPISRADLAKITQLTPPTVSSLVKELLDMELVMESEQGESKGGRKPTLLVINASSYQVVGLDVGPSSIKLVLTDLNGEIIDSAEDDVPKGVTRTDLLELMARNIENFIRKNPIHIDKLLGIGVGMHGIVDVDKGISLLAPNLHLKDIPIKDYLEDKFNVLVKVENDVRAMALGEFWFGAGRGSQSLVCINVGRGIGAGIIHDGKLFHGRHSIAGEIGHMIIDLNGPLCQCGNEGCLQAIASGPALVDLAIHAMNDGQETLLKNAKHGGPLSGESIYEAAKLGDTLARRLLAEAGKALGVGITNLIHVLNPDRIIIGGGVAKAEGFVFESLRGTIHKLVLTEKAKHTVVLPSELGQHATAIGAATLLLAELFATPTTD